LNKSDRHVVSFVKGAIEARGNGQVTLIAVSYGFDLGRSLEEGRWSVLSIGMAEKKAMRTRQKSRVFMEGTKLRWRAGLLSSVTASINCEADKTASMKLLECQGSS
jgi:hypothetical protein